MKDFYIAALFGAAQVLLLCITLLLLNRNKKIFALIVAAAKFAAYVRAVYLLFGKYPTHSVHCIIGFLFGVPLFAFLLLIVSAILKRFFRGFSPAKLLRPKRN